MNSRAEGERIARLLGMERLPREGGLFRRTYADAHSSVIYFMLLTPDFSALHALDSVETFHWYAGSPLRVHSRVRLSWGVAVEWILEGCW